jgi:protein transport protein SEC24
MSGNSLPRFIRSTLNLVPVTGALLDTSQLPLGLVIQPFAPLRYDETPIPYITDFGGLENQSEDEGPPRCEKCRGYVNPWVRWIEGGNKWQCNLCNAFTPVPAYYHSHLGPDGRRLDIASRPELNVGTVDFAVPKSYWALQPRSLLEEGGLDSTADLMGALQSAVGSTSSSSILPQPTTKEKIKEQAKQEKRMRKPKPMGRVFALDVSFGSVKSGLLREACEALKALLFAEDAIRQPVAIMTFDRSVQFYNLSVSVFFEFPSDSRHFDPRRR